MKYIITHGSVLNEQKLLKVGDSIELDPEEAKKMGGEECFVEATKHEAQQRAASAAKAELAKAGIKPDVKSEKGGK